MNVKGGKDTLEVRATNIRFVTEAVKAFGIDWHDKIRKCLDIQLEGK